MNQDNKPHDVQAEEVARSIANSLLQSFEPAVASVILTTALAFISNAHSSRMVRRPMKCPNT